MIRSLLIFIKLNALNTLNFVKDFFVTVSLN